MVGNCCWPNRFWLKFFLAQQILGRNFFYPNKIELEINGLKWFLCVVLLFCLCCALLNWTTTTQYDNATRQITFTKDLKNLRGENGMHRFFQFFWAWKCKNMTFLLLFLVFSYLKMCRSRNYFCFWCSLKIDLPQGKLLLQRISKI